MTTAVPSATPSHARTRYLPLAGAASLAHMAMMIPGYTEDGVFQTAAWLSMLAFSVVVAMLVFAFVVPGAGHVSGLVLGGVALVSVLGFWAGVTLPLAVGAGTVGWRVWKGGDRSWRAAAVLALAALSATLLVVAIVGDAMTS